MANIVNILPILVILCKEIKKHFGCDTFGSFTFKRHTFMLWHTSDVHKHHHFSLQALQFLYHMKRHTTETGLSPHINNPNHFQHHRLSDFTIITVTLSLLS